MPYFGKFCTVTNLSERFFAFAGICNGFNVSDKANTKLWITIEKSSDGFNCFNWQVLCLIKPQFEAGRLNLSKKGIVRDEKVRLRIRDEIAEFAQGCGFSVIGTETSPITGGDGNTEYLMCLEKR